MAFSRRVAILVVVLSLLLSLVHSASTPALATFIEEDATTGNNFSVSVNVPQINDGDDLFFSMSAPAGQGWIAFGFGSQMAGALIFLAYPSANGTGIMLSPRLGTGHVMPEFYPNVSVNVLSGSGIIDNTTYLVNAQCQHCRSWDGGSIDLNDTKQPMIYALGSSSDLVQSNSESATIQQHYANGQFTLNMRDATGAAGVPVANTTSSSTEVVESNDHNVSSAIHAILMAGSFIVGYPLGAIFLRAFGKVWLHWVTQSVTTLVVVVGAAAGIYISEKHGKNPHLNSPHQGLGLAIVLLVLGQLTLGALHHRMFKKTGSPITTGKIHRYLGPSVILCGIVNGALGFNFAGRNGYVVVYIVIVVIMIIGSVGVWYMRRRRLRRKEAMTSAAAQNFRQGDIPLNQYGQYGGWAPSHA